MIGKLWGRLDTVLDGACIFDVNGVGYLVQCSGRTTAAVQSAGGKASLLIETVVREDAILLYGFFDSGERDWFRLLTAVQGVGPKVALSLLSVLVPEAMAQAIRGGDKAALGRAPGVGAKLAARLVAELRDKIGSIAADPGIVPGVAGLPQPEGLEADAVSALINLGWKRPEAQAAVARAQKRLGEDAGLEDLIRDSLKQLARA